MPVTQFNKPKLLSNGCLDVSGPFDLEFDPAQLQGEVTIRFLLVQDVEGEAPVIVDDVAGWTGGPNWQRTVAASRVDRRLRASPVPDSPDKEGLCRGIGQAIVIRHVPPAPGRKPEPPIFDTITWCVTTEVDVG
jgi:hypothetical protein